jgi:hypothetical protein
MVVIEQAAPPALDAVSAKQLAQLTMKQASLLV